MRADEKDDHFKRRSRRKRQKYRRIRRLVIRLIAVCICLVAVIGIGAACLVVELKQRHTASPPVRLSEIAEEAETGADHPIDENEENSERDIGQSSQEDTDETSWCLILVNKWNKIQDDYQVELETLSNGQQVDQRIYAALQNMFDSARKDNIYPIVASGYRTTEKQQSIMDEKIQDYENEGCSPEEAKTKAEAWVAIPGTSEHQLGIAVDINADGIHSVGQQVYDWLNQNAYKYGFINRYPSDKTEITGVLNEPWHYRYVGVDAATEIQNQGVCLEEYLGKTN